MGRQVLSNYRISYKEDGVTTCFYCNCQVVYDVSFEGMDNFATLDHIIPKSKGGKNSKENLIISCALCNSLKDKESFFSFLRKVRTIEQRDKLKLERLEKSSLKRKKEYSDKGLNLIIKRQSFTFLNSYLSE